MGEPGGYGDMGRNRRVFYSIVAAPIIKRLVANASAGDLDILKALVEDREEV